MASSDRKAGALDGSWRMTLGCPNRPVSFAKAVIQGMKVTVLSSLLRQSGGMIGYVAFFPNVFHCSFEIKVERDTRNFAQPSMARTAFTADSERLACNQGLSDTLRMQECSTRILMLASSSVDDS